MVKKGADRAKRSGSDERYTVVIDPDLNVKIGIISQVSGISKPDWINNRLREVLEQEYPRVLRSAGLQEIKPDSSK